MYLPFFWDPTMIILIPGIILALYAQSKVNSTFARYSRVPSSRGITGAAMAREILRAKGLDYIAVEQIQGHLGDHYDPLKKVLRLSAPVYNSTSLAALGIAAHETGHAMQHSAGYLPLNLRNGLVPVANLGSRMALPLILLGLFVSPGLIQIGIYLFAAVVVFQLVTLPVEYNASKRALALLEGGGYLSGQELYGARAVLDAAALTYVAAALAAMLSLLRLFLLFGRRD